MPFWAASRVVAGAALDQQVFDVGDVDYRSAPGEDRDAGGAVASDVDDVVRAGAVGGNAVVARTAVDHHAIADAHVIDGDLFAAETLDDRRAGGRHGEVKRVVGRRAGHRHGVNGVVVAATEGREIDVDLLDAGAGQVADGDVVDATQRRDVDGLHAVQVHRDGPDIAREQRVRAVGRQHHVLVRVGAVELQRVGAGVALDDVAAIARVPDEGVVARAEHAPCRCRARH